MNTSQNLTYPVKSGMEHIPSAPSNVSDPFDNRYISHQRAIRSPLRYPGGKFRAVREIYSWLPADLDRICSPFVGGGSFELACAQSGIKVNAYDAFDPLVNFWKILLKDAPMLSRLAHKYFPMERDKFYSLQKKYATMKDKKRLAALFYALNRASFSGTTLSGGMSPGHPRFTEKGLRDLADFKIKNLSVDFADFRDSIKAHKNDFLYLDPPYANGSKLYGERGNCHIGFDHEGLANILRKRSGWILSYNDCNAVRTLYKGFKFVPVKWAYGMNNSKTSNEVLILNRD